MPTPYLRDLATRHSAIEECITALESKRENLYAHIEEQFSIWASESGATCELDFDAERALEQLLYGE